MFRRRQGSTPYARYCGVEDSWLALMTSILGLALRKIGPRAILREPSVTLTILVPPW
jgi:hypothetical protein